MHLLYRYTHIRISMLDFVCMLQIRNLSVAEAIDFLQGKRPQISINKFQRQRVTEFLEQNKSKQE